MKKIYHPLLIDSIDVISFPYRSKAEVANFRFNTFGLIPENIGSLSQAGDDFEDYNKNIEFIIREIK